MAFATPVKQKKKTLGLVASVEQVPDLHGSLDKLANEILQRGTSGVQTEKIELKWDTSRVAYKIRNVFTEEECRLLIEATERTGLYEPALLSTWQGQRLMPEYRNSKRVMVDHKGLSEAIFKRIYVNDKKFRSDIRFKMSDKYATPRELNERFRFLKYENGQYFKKHYDGSYVRQLGHPNEGDQSYFTVLIYLNADYSGSTRLFSDDSQQHYDVVPEVGMVFVHEHSILHEGSKIQGTKYAIRTDIMCHASNAD